MTPTTPLTCEQIQHALFVEHDKAGSIIAFNSTRVLRHETDVFVLRKSGVTLEFEVKVSRADFMADFRKVAKHQQLERGIKGGPNHFYFACEPGVIPVNKVPAYCGLVHIINHGQGRGYRYTVEVVKKAPKLHSHAPWPDIHLRLCRTLMYKAIRNGK